jgi:heterodisulfide reductase subunit A
MHMKRIGVFLCHCGTNIAAVVDVPKVAEVIRTLPNVALVQENKYCCSEPGQADIIKAIKDNNLDRIVVASCSPRMHEGTFQKAAAQAGLNPYMFEMANLREHCSWVHAKEPEKATAKAIDLVKKAVSKVAKVEPLYEDSIPVTKKALVIGGGIAGIQTAIDIADCGYPVILVEREATIGGRMAQLDKTFPTLDCSA